jgi:hypothetical protein
MVGLRRLGSCRNGICVAYLTNLCITSGASWLYNESRIYDTFARPWQRWVSENGNTGGNDGGGWFEYN